MTAALYHFGYITAELELNIFLIINILFGVGYIIFDIQLSRYRSAKVYAAVISYIEKSEVGTHAPGESINAYYTRVKYNIGGVMYQTIVRIGTIQPEIGQEIELRVDPNDPSDADLPEKSIKHILSWFVTLGSKAILSYILYTIIEQI